MHYFILTLVRHSLEKGKPLKFEKCGNHVKYILARTNWHVGFKCLCYCCKFKQL